MARTKPTHGRPGGDLRRAPAGAGPLPEGRWLAVGTRVALRYPVEADRQAFLALRRSSRREFQRGEPKPRPGFDPYGDDAFDMEMRRSRSRTARRLLICRRDDGVVVGHVGMGVIVRGDLQQCFVGYWIGTPFTGRGFMTEALRLAADFIFLRLGLHRFECNIQPTNGASRAVARRAGLRCEGLSPRYLKIAGAWADHERWAMTREDWEAQRTSPGMGGLRAPGGVRGGRATQPR